ncbi:MAG: hypothetical protein IPM57_09195 [Oligoflexia bacterium]|nr:hypothetical protein [Oligoflexia bacterium]
MKTIFLIFLLPHLLLAAPKEDESAEPIATKRLVEIDKTAQNQKTDKADFFFTDTQSICIYGGAIYNLTSEASVIYGLWGLTYTFPSQTRFHFESSFDIFASQEGHLRFMGRWSSRISEKLRPFVNAGLGLVILPNDNAGVVLSWGRLFAQLGTGLEWSFTQHTSLRLEAFAGATISTQSFVAALMGYSLSF